MSTPSPSGQVQRWFSRLPWIAGLFVVALALTFGLILFLADAADGEALSTPVAIFVTAVLVGFFAAPVYGLWRLGRAIGVYIAALRGDLRDASRPSSRGLVETTLRLCFKPLLLSTMTTTTSQGNPSVLVETLLTMDYPNAAVDWILCWFARQFNNLDVMNRVLDFFMASHAMMPL